MTDIFELTLSSPITEEQWDAITDVDFDHTDRITFHTKHGKEVEFSKVRHGKWMPLPYDSGGYWKCSNCETPTEASGANLLYKYCPFCGARMVEE